MLKHLKNTSISEENVKKAADSELKRNDLFPHFRPSFHSGSTSHTWHKETKNCQHAIAFASSGSFLFILSN